MRRMRRTGRRPARPAAPEAYCNIGVVFKMTDHVDDAVRVRAVSSFIARVCAREEEFVARFDGSRHRVEEEVAAEAVATYERALTYDSTNVGAYYNLGVAYAR